jgi:HK97 family phage major capsid protein
MNLQEMKQEQKAALDAAEKVVSTAEVAGRGLTNTEHETYTTNMAKYKAMTTTIKAREEQNTIRTLWPSGRPGLDAPVAGQFVHTLGGGQPFAQPTANDAARRAETHTTEYKEALHSFLKSGGKAHAGDLSSGSDGLGGFYVPGSEQFTGQRLPNGRPSAATYEGTDGGSGAAGGYAVSIPTVQLIVPLGMPDLGIFDASMVLPTSTDIKIPQQASFGTSAIKSESTGTVATFGGSDPSLQQTELRSYMIGAARVVSWELLQDVESFNAFVTDDLIRGQRITEGALLATGTGTNQPTGVFGNTGIGTGAAYAFTGAAADSTLLLNALFDVTATLKGVYQPNASWVMSRATGLVIRRAQMQTNLFAPVATVDPDGTERILGRPVYYDVNSPALPSATNAGVIPILYGDFKAGNLIGVRGGGGVNVKVLDQPLAMQGQLAILAYRRLDSKIRRSEAIQAITIAHS